MSTLAPLTIGYVGGGSRGWALTLINDLAAAPDIDAEVRLYDVDHAAAKRNERFGNWAEDRDEAVGDVTYRAVPNTADALRGADVVVASTQPDPAETRIPELRTAREYGHYHAAAGGSVGPGGVFRSLREMPTYRDLARVVGEYCPDALVVNYSNPMTTLTRSLYDAYPDIEAIGLCHEVAHTRSYFASLVEKHRDVSGVSGDDLDVSVSGVNHFTWVTSAEWNGVDVHDLLDRELKVVGPLPAYGPGNMTGESAFVNHHHITLDLYRRYGACPAVGDRHLPEFAPHYLRVDDPDELHRWGIRATPDSYYLDRVDDIAERVEAQMRGDEPFELAPSGEVVVDVLRAVAGGEELVINANYPNEGQAPGLTRDAVVETNVRISENGVEPIETDPLPRPVRSMVSTHVDNQETLVAAGAEGDLDLAFRAFRNDPQALEYQPDTCRDLFMDLVATSRECLADDWDLDGATVLAE
jgi:alpha-galactosidase